jgi:hypothetical protein
VTTFKAAFFEEFTFARIGKLAWSLPLRLCGLSSYWTVAQSLEFKPQYCQKEKKSQLLLDSERGERRGRHS